MRRLLLMAVMVAVTTAACGGDETGSETTTTVAETTTTTEATTTTSEATTTTTTEASPEPITVTGADGVESTITDTSRVVSLNGDLTEIIYALGLGDRVVAVDVTTIYPPETEPLPRVGFGQQLAPEGVLAFQPTVVIGDTQVGPRETIDQLRAAGIPVVIVDVYTTLDTVDDKILKVAEALGATEAGTALADQVLAEIEAAQTLVAGVEEGPTVAFLYVRGPQQVFLFGRGMVTSALIEGAAAVDAAAASGINGLVPLTPEALVAAAPDVIIAPALGVGALGGPEALAGLPGVAETPAGRDGRFLVYEDAFFLNFGPRTGQALEALILDLYPDID